MYITNFGNILVLLSAVFKQIYSNIKHIFILTAPLISSFPTPRQEQSVTKTHHNYTSELEMLWNLVYIIYHLTKKNTKSIIKIDKEKIFEVAWIVTYNTGFCGSRFRQLGHGLRYFPIWSCEWDWTGNSIFWVLLPEPGSGWDFNQSCRTGPYLVPRLSKVPGSFNWSNK